MSTQRAEELIKKYGDARVARALHNSDENTARIDVARNALIEHIEQAEARAEKLTRLLEKAGGLIRQWHGMGMPQPYESRAWKLYQENAPEMQPFRDYFAALADATSKDAT